MITARYRILQVVRDHGSPEPETVGVLVHTEASAELRLIGATANSSRFEHGFFRHALPDLTSADWVYEQWISWFRDVVAAMPANPDKALGLLQALESRSEPLIATVSGDMAIGGEDAVAEAADQLYGQLVLSKPSVRRAQFLGAVDDLLDVSELRWFAGLHLDAEVELVDSDHRTTHILYLPYVWDSPDHGRFAIKPVWFGGTEREVSAAVADAANTFEIAQRQRILRPECCIVVHDTPVDPQRRYLRTLGFSATAIDVYGPTAVDDLRRVFFGA